MFEKVMAHLGLEPREQQVRMLGHVRDMFDAPFTSTPVTLIQAGTGTGKSFVILSEAAAAAGRSGLPSLVVCPNNTLINQYVLKDAPKVAEATGAKFVYIKGRARYVCVNSEAIRGQALRDFQSKRPNTPQEKWLKRRRNELFAEVTHGSDSFEWADLGLLKEWGCPGSRRCKPKLFCSCDAYNPPEGQSVNPRACTCTPKCGALLARLQAWSADVVITNAHVLMWDHLVRLWSDGVSSLVPDYGALFVDECHELEGVGRDVMSDEIGHRSKLWVDSKVADEWRKAQIESMRSDQASERHLDVSKSYPIIAQLKEEIAQNKWTDLDDEYDRVQTFIRFLTERDGTLALIQLQLGDVDSPGAVAPVVSFVCQRRLINASEDFRAILTKQPSVLASGTIPPSDRRRLGLRKTQIQYVGHPFDYSKSQLYIAPYDARDRSDLADRVRMVVKGIRAAQRDGTGTLLLFTSWADLDLVSRAIADDLGPDAPVWVQGREDDYAASGTTLADDVAEFVEHGSGVLCGVRSLFTGLDIPGSALGQVVVWKLPYAVPTAEVKAIQDTFGRSTYTDSMIMTLVQAAGRLVRTHTDQGRVMIMDDRAKRLDFGSNPMMHHLSEFTRVGW